MIMHVLDYYLHPLQVVSSLTSQSHLAFLDSSDEHNQYSHYSIIAIEPFLTLSYQQGTLRLSCAERNGELPFPLFKVSEQATCSRDPFSLLEVLLKTYTLPEIPSLPFPLGACLGYISYDLGSAREAKTPILPGFEDWPQMEWAFYDTLIVFDLHGRSIHLVSTGFPYQEKEQDQQAKSRLAHFCALLEQSRDALKSPIEANALETTFLGLGDFELQSNFSSASYQQAVERIKEYIAQGDVYQVNLSQQFSGRIQEDGLALYQRIRRINQVPYGGYLRFGGREILSFSMERFLRMEDQRVQTRPIKGTRPRGHNPQEDQRHLLELLISEKDQAELLMVVDMERNDLSKVCAYHSVTVDQLFEVEKYATVFHLVSTVSGLLKPSFSHLDCLLACFPGGSISGTPKIRAMEIIAELEGVKRGIYCGAIGYFGFNKVSDFNIPIRTILKQGSRIWFNAGGGVIIDSEPQLEYLETLHKVRSFLACLKAEQCYQEKWP